MAAGPTYQSIATTTLGSASYPVTFSSIPSTYTDLILTINGAGASTNDIYCRVNSDSGSNYSRTILYGDGTTAGSVRASNATAATLDYYGGLDTTVGNSVQIVHFMNYSNSTTYKTILVRSNRAGAGTDAMVNLWRSTAAINRIDLYIGGSLNINWAIGSTLTLYGIAAA